MNMMQERGGLQVAAELVHLAGHEILSGLGIASARALVFEGRAQPSGYTEPLLHGFRSRKKGVRKKLSWKVDPDCYLDRVGIFMILRLAAGIFPQCPRGDANAVDR